MTGDTAFSPNDPSLSSNANLHITIDEGSQNSENLLEEEGNDLENDCEQLFEIDGDDHENGMDVKNDHYFDIESNGHEDDGDDTNEHLFDIDGNGHENNVDEQLFDIEGSGHEDNKDDACLVDDGSGTSQRKVYPPPVVGMEFESYDDAYNFYNCYAKEIGFAIRVKSSWTKRNSKEKRGAVLCCNCEGFKTVKDANSRRKETRTGCLAMIRLRLVESTDGGWMKLSLSTTICLILKELKTPSHIRGLILEQKGRWSQHLMLKYELSSYTVHLPLIQLAMVARTQTKEKLTANVIGLGP
ncbi:hypothetical protein F8388_026990 [Cannabis sativa]|uniref:FAR1 domain-containing protein n=1 Tax=Cannabis sativa TaxID=3483 RepID=A0A7J6FNV2_CANSA|nr:hypothetical protein F8388_026990 [Cannabis sativa]